MVRKGKNQRRSNPEIPRSGTEHLRVLDNLFEGIPAVDFGKENQTSKSYTTICLQLDQPQGINVMTNPSAMKASCWGIPHSASKKVRRAASGQNEPPRYGAGR